MSEPSPERVPVPATAPAPEAAPEPPRRPDPQPAIGRDVHYVSHGTPLRSDGSQEYPAACRSAKITEVDPNDPGRVGLMVFNPNGPTSYPLAGGGSVYAITGASLGGTWHWPEWI
ncbi:hypothetical protein ABZ543_07985 [Streptomyces roseifaciens]